MLKFITSFALVATCALGQSTSGFNPDPLAGGWNVFGNDDRQEVTNRAWPWSTIGKIEVAGSYCTATLIGARLVLTAEHCLKLRNGRLNSSYRYRFFPNVIRNHSAVANSPEAIRVWSGGYRGSHRGRDWAILLLDRQPKRSNGTHFGWMGVSGSGVRRGQNIGVIGYSSNFRSGRTAGADLTCEVRATYRLGTFFHDCDGWGGVSGGPAITRDGESTIVGITNAHYSKGTPGKYLRYYTSEYANIGASSSSFIRTLNRLKRTYQ